MLSFQNENVRETFLYNIRKVSDRINKISRIVFTQPFFYLKKNSRGINIYIDYMYNLSSVKLIGMDTVN